MSKPKKQKPEKKRPDLEEKRKEEEEEDDQSWDALDYIDDGDGPTDENTLY